MQYFECSLAKSSLQMRSRGDVKEGSTSDAGRSAQGGNRGSARLRGAGALGEAWKQPQLQPRPSAPQCWARSSGEGGLPPPRGAKPGRPLCSRRVSMAPLRLSRSPSEMSAGAAAARSREGSPAEDGFAPSALGTREHWDAVYERELQTFQDYGDTGEIWFGEESMNRLIKWMQKHKIPLDASVLDIGTGNGVFLVELAKFGFSNITGIDYSPSAIQLSGNIIEKEGLSNITLKVEDFLNLSTKLSGFHICIDKGTFDAISLNPDNAVEKRKQYVKSLSRVLRVKGFFLITSCNWTKEELLNEFSEGFELFEELPTPKFSFGGRSGNSVAALVFQKL